MITKRANHRREYLKVRIYFRMYFRFHINNLIALQYFQFSLSCCLSVAFVSVEMSLIRAWAKRAEMVVDIPNEVVDDEHQPNVSLQNNSLPTANESGLGIVDHERVLDAIAETTDSRGKYHIYTPEIRFKIGKFASESNSSATAVRKFRDRYPNMNESTVRGFRIKYEHMVKKQL